MFKKFTNVFKAVLCFILLPMIGFSQISMDDNLSWGNFNPAGFNFNNTMTIIAVVNVEGVESTDSDVLAAFIGGELRGVDTLRDVSGRYLVAIQIASNDLGQDAGQDIIFRLWDKGKDVVLPVIDTIPYMPQQVLGSVGVPQVLNTINVEITFTKDDVLCSADNYGWVKADITGGKQPYVLDWAKAGDPGLAIDGDGTDSIYHLFEGKYYLSVTDGNNFTKVDSVIIENTMKPIQAPIIVSGLTDPICEGADMVLFAYNNETEVPRFIRWYDIFGDPILDGPVLQLPDIQNTTLVQAQSFVRNCTSDTTKQAIAVAEAPNANFSVSSRLVQPNQEVIFLADEVVNAYQYDWDFGDGNTAQGPTANHAYATIGFFEVTLTVTTPSGCVAEETVSIRVEEDFFAILEVDHVFCQDDNTGRIISQVINGRPPYTYAWSNGGTESYIENLSVGVYTLTVTDALGDQVVVSTTVNAEIDQLPNPVITINDGAPVCYGEDIEVAAVSAVPGVDYFWYNAPTNGKLLHVGSLLTLQNVQADRTLYVETRYKECSSPDRIEVEIDVTKPNANFVLSPNAAKIDTDVFFYAQNILQDYYYWDFGNSRISEGPRVFEPKTSYQQPGVYFVTLTTTLNGCQASETRPIQAVVPEEEVEIDLNVLVETTYPACENDSTGSIQVQVLNGANPINYYWDPLVSEGATASNLAAGTYRVTITDGKQRSAVRSVTLSPALGEVAMPDSVLIEKPACYGEDITLTVVNDDPASSFFWYDQAVDGALLYVGDQVILESVTSNQVLFVERRTNSCTSSERLRVEVEVEELDAGFSVSEFLLPLSGTLELQANATEEGYSYLWDFGNGDVDSTSGDSTAYAYAQAGDYQLSLTVTTEEGCSKTTSYTIQVVKQVLELEFDITNPVCADDASGVIAVQVKDGVAPFSFQWNTGADETVVTNLVPGTYTVSVTDSEGNKSIGSITLESQIDVVPQALVLVNGGNDYCVGEVIQLNAFSDQAGAEFFWYDGQNPDQLRFVGNTMTLTVGAPQSFLVETHFGSCVTTSLTLVNIQGTAPDASFTVSADQTDINVAIDFAATSVDPANTYEWDFGDGAISNTALSSHAYSSGGIYQVSLTVTDEGGCQSTTSQFIQVNETQSLFALFNVENVKCVDDTTGTVTATALNGASPYSFNWSTGSTASSITGLGSGTYYLTITDNDGNTVEDSVTVMSEVGLLAAPQVINYLGDTLCVGKSTTLYAFTDRTDVNFLWYDQAEGGNIVGVESPLQINNVEASQTFFAETNLGGCASPTRTEVQIEVINPNRGFIATPTTVVVGEEVSFTPNDLDESYSYKWEFEDGTISIVPVFAKSFDAEGQYTVSLISISPEGCVGVEQKEDYITVISSTGLTAILNVTDVTCEDDTDGSITASVFNASGAISYAWSTGETTETISDLSEGTYTVTVMDGSGLSITRSAEVGRQNATPEQPSIALNAPSPLCAGSNVTLLGLNGSPVDEYRWYNSSGELVFVGSTFIIPDIQESQSFQLQALAGSCLSEMSSIDIEVQKPNAEFSVAPGTTAAIGETLKFSPEISSYPDYLWQFGDGNVSESVEVDKSFATAGNFTVSFTVTDEDGCSVTESKDGLITILGDNNLAFEIVSVNDILCDEDATGAITVRGIGGVPPYSYSWSNDSTGATLSNLTAGIYSFTITDSDQVSVNGAAEVKNLGSAIPAANVNINGGGAACLNTDVFLVASSPGFSNANFEWYADFSSADPSSEGNSLVIRDIQSDTSVFVSTNINGCVSERIEVAINTQVPDADFSVSPSTNLMEGDLVQFSPNTILEDHSYDWSFGDNGWSSFVEPYYFYNMPGVYDVRLTVTDPDGCEGTVIKTEYINVEKMEEPPGFTGGGEEEGSPELQSNARNDRVQPIPAKVFPNPFVTELTVLFKAEIEDTYTLELTDMLGRVIWLQDMELSGGLVMQQIPVDELGMTNGLYLLQIRNGVQQTTLKVLKNE